MQPSVSMIKELLSDQPEKMQGRKITERSFSQETHLKTLGHLTKELEIVYKGKHTMQVLLSILILAVSLTEDSQMIVTQPDLSASDHCELGTGFQFGAVT